MSLARRFWTVTSILVLHLAVVDVIGVVGCFVLDVAPLRHGSVALPVAVWFVLGAFCGVLSYIRAAQALSADPAQIPGQVDATTGNFVLRISIATMAALALVFHRLWWRFNWFGGEFFVPDAGIPTLTFFGGVAAAMLITRHAFLPGKGA